MSTLTTLLKLTPHQADMVYLDLYMRWCESVTVNEQQLQMVLANASVNKYFNFEYAKCIAKFIDHMSNYPDATANAALQQYGLCTIDLFNHRSPVLIKNAIKNNIEYDAAKN